MSFWSRDVRLAARSLRKSAGFTAAAVLTLALGLGATTAVLTLVRAAMLDALPFRDPDGIVFVRGRMTRDGATDAYPIGVQDVRSLAEQARLFERVAAVSGPRPFNLGADGRVEHVTGELAGADYFRILGVPVAVGRAFTEREAAPGTALPVVVLAHDYWRSRFGGERAVVGRTIELNERAYEVLGVAAPGFRGVSGEAQLWLPMGLAGPLYGPHYLDNRQFRWLSGVARLDAGSDAARTTRALDAASARLRAAFPTENAGLDYTLQPLHDAFFGELRRPLLALLGASAFVLLIACVNLANLLLARGVSRRQELAVRVALGARTRELVRQQLAESVLLVGSGLALGLALAVGTLGALVRTGLVDLGSYARPQVNWLVVLAMALVAVLVALAVGAAPVLHALRVAPVDGLSAGSGRSGTGGRQRARFQRALVAAEVALAMTLLVGAGLMLKGLRQYLSSDLGFRPDRLLTMRLDLTAERFRENAAVWAVARASLERLGATPGVEQVALEGPGLPTSGWYAAHFHREDDTSPAPVDHMVRRHHVSPSYFATMGIPLKAGRTFGAEDVPTAPRAVVVSEAMAKRVWPEGSPVGRRLKGVGPNAPTYTVVGVVGEVAHGGRNPESLDAPDLYISVFQSPPRSPAVLNVIVRTGLPLAAAVRATRAALAEAAPRLPSYDAMTMTERLREQTTSARLLVLLMGSFAGVAVLLALLGVYGVLSYVVAQRTRELGIRAALGADRAELLRHVVVQGIAPALAGVALGAVGGLAVTRLVRSMLYGVSPTDPATFAGVAALLVAAAAVACWIPALRASRADPQTAMRAE